MSKNPIDRDAITAYIRRLGNPYAKSQIIGAEEDEQEARLDFRSADPDLRPPTEAERAYARKQGNQYTLLSVAIRDPAEVPARAATTAETPKERPAPKPTLSKSDFIKECGRIFRPYIPSVEKGRLRRHHRDFITRNQNRTPSARYLLVQQLSKYDLTVLPGMESRFNRERGDLTDHKLKQIEQSAFADDSKK